MPQDDFEGVGERTDPEHLPRLSHVMAQITATDRLFMRFISPRYIYTLMRTAAVQEVIAHRRPPWHRCPPVLVTIGAVLNFRCAHRAHCDRSPSGSPVCLHRLETPTVARRRFVQDVAAHATVIAAVSATRIVTAAGTVHDSVRAADRGRKGPILTVVTRPSSYRTNINTHSPRSPA